MPAANKLRIAMLVVDANDHLDDQGRDGSRQSPVLHTAIHNLLDGLKSRDDIEVEVIYGARDVDDVASRWDGSLHYIALPYKSLPIPGMGGSYLGRLLAISKY